MKDLAHVYSVAPRDSRGSITKDTTLKAQLIHNKRQKKTHCRSWATHTWKRSCEQDKCKTGKTFGKPYKQSMMSWTCIFNRTVARKNHGVFQIQGNVTFTLAPVRPFANHGSRCPLSSARSVEAAKSSPAETAIPQREHGAWELKSSVQ